MILKLFVKKIEKENLTLATGWQLSFFLEKLAVGCGSNQTFPPEVPWLYLMKWDMEIEEIEAVLEKIWDLHDKLSDAIHSVSRSHFLNSIRNLRKSNQKKLYNDAVEENRDGFVYAKDFRLDDNESAIQEAKSLNAIRTALENLEDQLEFFHVSPIASLFIYFWCVYFGWILFRRWQTLGEGTKLEDNIVLWLQIMC